MRSRIHTALVRHERFHPRDHCFAYRLPVFVLHLEELESGMLNGPLFGFDRARPLSVLSRDYLTEDAAGLGAKFSVFSRSHLPGCEETGDVFLVTSARYLGYVFSPVNFWHCLEPGGTPAGFLAEVNNTFDEKHVYPLEATEAAFPAHPSAEKRFHVSPFNDRNGCYRFSFGDIRNTLDIGVELHREDQLVLRATLRAEGPGVPVTTSGIARVFGRHPLLPLLTMPRIIWQAAALRFRKKLTFHPKPRPDSPMTIRNASNRSLFRLPGLFETPVVNLLSRARSGRLTLHSDDRTLAFVGEMPGPEAVMTVHDRTLFRRLALESDIGLGEAYADGLWDTDDLTALLGFFLHNREDLSLPGIIRLPESFFRLARSLVRSTDRRNTRSMAKANIHAHYDLGNRLFQSFLDPAMTYSCACFENDCQDLHSAQEAKFRRLAQGVGIRSGDHVLEIGCGWGGFTIYAAQTFDCRVTGLTISREQHELALQRVSEAGLEDRIEIRLQDYRDVRGIFDRIVSIEMLEAVGHAFHPEYFRTLDRLLAPGGLAALQVICIQDQRYDAYRRRGDWINRHIFPGGLCPSLTRIMEVLRDHTDFIVRRAENIGHDYVRTLDLWRERFLGCWRDELKNHGYDERFRRAWEYYFSYCEAGFACRVLTDYQIILERPCATRGGVV